MEKLTYRYGNQLLQSCIMIEQYLFLWTTSYQILVGTLGEFRRALKLLGIGQDLVRLGTLKDGQSRFFFYFITDNKNYTIFMSLFD